MSCGRICSQISISGPLYVRPLYLFPGREVGAVMESRGIRGGEATGGGGLYGSMGRGRELIGVVGTWGE